MYFYYIKNTNVTSTSFYTLAFLLPIRNDWIISKCCTIALLPRINVLSALFAWDRCSPCALSLESVYSLRTLPNIIFAS